MRHILKVRWVAMRAGILLAALLSLATPQVSWGAIEASMSSRDTIVLKASATGQAQISRPVTKTDKTFGTAFTAPAAIALLIPHYGVSDLAPFAPSDPPNVPFDCPPLAPRPPPLY